MYDLRLIACARSYRRFQDGDPTMRTALSGVHADGGQSRAREGGFGESREIVREAVSSLTTRGDASPQRFQA